MSTRSISVPYIPSSANSQAKNKNEAHRMEGNMQQSFYSEKEMFADALTAEKNSHHALQYLFLMSVSMKM